jgi:hypothetical protein
VAAGKRGKEGRRKRGGDYFGTLDGMKLCSYDWGTTEHLIFTRTLYLCCLCQVLPEAETPQSLGLSVPLKTLPLEKEKFKHSAEKPPIETPLDFGSLLILRRFCSGHICLGLGMLLGMPRKTIFDVTKLRSAEYQVHPGPRLRGTALWHPSLKEDPLSPKTTPQSLEHC